MSTWRTCRLKDLGRIITGKTPQTSNAANYGGAIPFVTPTDMDGRRTIDRTLRTLSATGALAVKSSIIFGPAIAVSCIGSDMGKAAIVPGRYVSNQQINSLVPNKENDARFIYYNLLGRRAEIRGLASGAAQPIMNKSSFGELTINIPLLAEQQAIGHTLGRLDDKIELNRHMNETLEAMTQAIFFDWFIDFGPVRRKLTGETDPVAIMGGLTSDTARATKLAKLFPAVLTDEGLPQGWTDRPIGELVEIAGGSTPSTADDSLWSPAEHRWATPKDLSNMSDLALFETGRRISSAGLARITSGLLPVGTVLLSSRAPIGYLAIAQEPVAINQGFIALKPTVDQGSAYLYLWCKANMEAILANANGSTFQEISKKNFRPITSAVPNDPAILRAFSEIAQPHIDRIVSAARENLTLAETRDYLLPRLMSGEVRVASAEVIA